MSLNFSKRINKSKWFKFEGAEFLIAPIDNPNYQQHIASGVKFDDYMKLAAEHGSSLDDADLVNLAFKDLSITEVKRRTAEALSKHVVIDWRGIIDDNEDPVKYTNELCYTFLEQDPEFTSFAQQKAEELSTQASVETNAKVKKLKTGSTGK